MYFTLINQCLYKILIKGNNVRFRDFEEFFSRVREKQLHLDNTFNKWIDGAPVLGLLSKPLVISHPQEFHIGFDVNY